MKTAVTKVLGIMAMVATMTIAGCENEPETKIAGSAENAGAALDKAAKKAVEATEDFSEKAVRKTGEALEKAGAAMEKAGAEMQE